MWLKYEQEGKVGLGKGAVGPELKFRKRIVQTLGAGEHEDIDELKDLPEEACDSLYENPIKLIADFAINAGPLSAFLSRKDKEAGEKTPATPSPSGWPPQLFKEVWGQVTMQGFRRSLLSSSMFLTSLVSLQDPRHKVEVNKQFIIIRLRHRPTFKWCCQWIPDDKDAQDCKLKRSHVLGPQKLPYIHSRAPAFHSEDAVLFPLLRCSLH